MTTTKRLPSHDRGTDNAVLGELFNRRLILRIVPKKCPDLVPQLLPNRQAARNRAHQSGMDCIFRFAAFYGLDGVSSERRVWKLVQDLCCECVC